MAPAGAARRDGCGRGCRPAGGAAASRADGASAPTPAGRRPCGGAGRGVVATPTASRRVCLTMPRFRRRGGGESGPSAHKVRGLGQFRRAISLRGVGHHSVGQARASEDGRRTADGRGRRAAAQGPTGPARRGAGDRWGVPRRRRAELAGLGGRGQRAGARGAARGGGLGARVGHPWGGSRREAGLRIARWRGPPDFGLGDRGPVAAAGAPPEGKWPSHDRRVVQLASPGGGADLTPWPPSLKGRGSAARDRTGKARQRCRLHQKAENARGRAPAARGVGGLLLGCAGRPRRQYRTSGPILASGRGGEAGPGHQGARRARLPLPLGEGRGGGGGLAPPGGAPPGAPDRGAEGRAGGGRRHPPGAPEAV
jgi:hypothetical protein